MTLPGTRGYQEVAVVEELSPDMLQIAQALDCSPPGLASALGEALGLSSDAPAEVIARAMSPLPELALARCAEMKAEQIVSGDLTVAVGPGKLLESSWVLAGRMDLKLTLAQVYMIYLKEILEICRVSTVFNELTLPVSSWRHPVADAAVSEMHARQLWGCVGSHDKQAPWASLGVGFTKLDNFLSPDLASRARAELEALESQGELSDPSTSTCNPGSRHIWLRFGTEEDRQAMQNRSPALLELGDALSGLPGAVESACAKAGIAAPKLRINPRFVATSYGPGTYYVPHKDMYSGGSAGFENSRLLTVICYLNPGWKPGDGGELRLFAGRDTLPGHDVRGPGSEIPDLLGITADHSESTSATTHEADRFVDIAPLLGRVVMFRSREVWHAIQGPAYARWAVQIWVLADTT